MRDVLHTHHTVLVEVNLDRYCGEPNGRTHTDSRLLMLLLTLLSALLPPLTIEAKPLTLVHTHTHSQKPVSHAGVFRTRSWKIINFTYTSARRSGLVVYTWKRDQCREPPVLLGRWQALARSACVYDVCARARSIAR